MASNEGVFGKLLATLERTGYESKYEVIKSQDYGVPQNRRRLILIASRQGCVQIPAKTHGLGTPNPTYSTVGEWIGDLPAIEAGSSHPHVPNHTAAALSPLNYEWITNTPVNGGRKDWPARLVLKCHSNGYGGHTDVYGRMRSDELASCLTTRCTGLSNGRFGHPSQNRAISAREAASLQTFPRDFLFSGSMKSVSRQIGNAVPPLLARRFGEYLVEHVLQHSRE